MNAYTIHSRREKLEALEAIGYEFMSLAKHYDTFYTGRGELVALRTGEIAKILYYDDETPDPASGPGGLEGAFLAYNRHHAFTECLEWAQAREDLRTRGCCAGKWAPAPSIYRYSSDEPYSLEFYRAEWRDNKAPDTRELDSAETLELLELARAYEAAHVAKLRRYFARHSDKVYTSGYWANR